MAVGCGFIGYEPEDEAPRPEDTPSGAPPFLAGVAEGCLGETDFGSPEVCNGLDDDCDGEVDEDACEANCAGANFAGRAYQVCFAEAISWEAAVDGCLLAGMQLVRVESAAEDDFLSETLVPTLFPEATSYWMGGSDVAVEGQWRWLDGTIFWDELAQPGPEVDGQYVNWAFDQPDNGTGENEHCLVYLYAVGGWNDRGCIDDDVTQVFVCAD